MKYFFVITIMLLSVVAHAESRYTWLCGGRHELRPRQYSTEFFVTVDLDTIRTENNKQFIDAYLETTPMSKIPANGFAEVVQLELIGYEELGGTIYLNIEAHNLLINGTTLTFFTVGMDIPDDGRSIIFSSFVETIPLDGNCRRRPDMDHLWSSEE